MHADPKLDVVALVEDEVILGLPMVRWPRAGRSARPVVAGGKATTRIAIQRVGGAEAAVNRFD